MCPRWARLGLGLTRADAVLPDEARRAPGPARAQGSGARSEGDPGVVGPTGDGGAGTQPGHQGVPVADGGHVWSTVLQRGASLAVSEEGLAGRAQAAVAALEVEALVGTAPGQLLALVDIWRGAEPGDVPRWLRARCSRSTGLQPPLLLSGPPQNPAASPVHTGLPPSPPSPGPPPASSPAPASTAQRGPPTAPSSGLRTPVSLSTPPFSLLVRSIPPAKPL